jgi:hypothetical protein
MEGTVVRVHHLAAGARHEPPKDIPAEVFGVLDAPVRPAESTVGSME